MTRPISMEPNTFAAIVRAVTIHRQNFVKVAGRFGITPQHVSRLMERHRKAEGAPTEPIYGHVLDTGRATPSLESIDEAARAMAAPRSLTAILCGDPSPQRSALSSFVPPLDTSGRSAAKREADLRYEMRRRRKAK